ncbi:hypothetical protein BD410DRAFT_810795 [Rickenella mellea]|uniref:Uncharacterized protein n=1 Tax=Rickenella mellea TaxID=50990 RepID=A0A4Y7PFN0_9AGAM|nr:hypothetical protein BD410DRAFT_810795 [Rickenella mellea]
MPLWSERFKESLPEDEKAREEVLVETLVRVKSWYNNRTRNISANSKASKPTAKGSKHVFKPKQKLQPVQAYQKMFQDELKLKVDAAFKVYEAECIAEGLENKGRLYIHNKIAKEDLTAASPEVLEKVEEYRNSSMEENVPEYLIDARDAMSDEDFDRFMANHRMQRSQDGLTRFVHTHLDKITTQIRGVAIILIGAPEPQNEGNVVTWISSREGEMESNQSFQQYLGPTKFKMLQDWWKDYCKSSFSPEMRKQRALFSAKTLRFLPFMEESSLHPGFKGACHRKHAL